MKSRAFKQDPEQKLRVSKRSSKVAGRTTTGQPPGPKPPSPRSQDSCFNQVQSPSSILPVQKVLSSSHHQTPRALQALFRPGLARGVVLEVGGREVGNAVEGLAAVVAVLHRHAHGVELLGKPGARRPATIKKQGGGVGGAGEVGRCLGAD